MTKVDQKLLEKVYIGDCVAGMKSLIPDNSIHLIVTSPPYPGVKMWDSFWGDKNYGDMLDDLDHCWEESFRVLIPGRKLCINIPNILRGGVDDKQYPNVAHTIFSCRKIGFNFTDEIIWNKGVVSTPLMRDFPHPVEISINHPSFENILIFEKPITIANSTYSKPKEKYTEDIVRQSFLDSRCKEWMVYPIWIISPGKAEHAEHIAPFPPDIPGRCIRLWSFVGDIVLDPYAGIGTTLLIAKKLRRTGVGFEIVHEYATKANLELRQEMLL